MSWVVFNIEYDVYFSFSATTISPDNDLKYRIFVVVLVCILCVVCDVIHKCCVIDSSHVCFDGLHLQSAGRFRHSNLQPGKADAICSFSDSVEFLKAWKSKVKHFNSH